MDTSTLVVMVLLVVVVVALLAVVLQLRGQVTRLAHEVTDVRHESAAQVQSAETARHDAEARRHDALRELEQARAAEVAVPEEQPDLPADDVSLITDIDQSDEPDQTVRTSRVVSTTLGEPLIKAAALAHGVRHALDDEGRIRIRVAAKKELKRQRKQRRRAKKQRAANRSMVEGEDS